jgi:hypothetical protein
VGSSISRSARFNHDTEPTASRDAMWVLISSEICATETPRMAGPICASTRRTPGWRHAAPMRAGVTPKRGR